MQIRNCEMKFENSNDTDERNKKLEMFEFIF